MAARGNRCHGEVEGEGKERERERREEREERSRVSQRDAQKGNC